MRVGAWSLSLLAVSLGCAVDPYGVGTGGGGLPAPTTSTGEPDDTSATGTTTASMSSGAASGEATSSSSGEGSEGTTVALDDGSSSGGGPTSGGSSDEAGSSSGGLPPSTLPEQPCTDEGTIMSTRGAQAATVTFHNASGEGRRIYWLDYSGMRDGFGTMAPDEAWEFGSYVTHPFLIADESDACLVIYVTEAGDHDVWLD